MTNIITRSSALALKKETVEGTPVVPTASTDYMKLQDDFSMEPNFEELENAEASSSIGASKSILGAESPTASFSGYIKGSAVEGQAPNYGPLMESLFGSEHIRSTERDTIAGSTTSLIKVAVGEGVEFARGHLMLIKDSVNNYTARFAESISGDDITPGFNLQNAPASGVNLGLGVSYLPVNEGHPTLSVWHYMGNQGAIQMQSGVRVVSAAVNVTAGQLINSNYSMEGLEYFFDPITLTAADNVIDFNDGGALQATLEAKTYKDPHELLETLAAAMNALSSDTITAVYDDATGKTTIATDGITLSLLWTSANSIGAKLGFVIASDDTGATSYLSDNAQDYSSPQNAAYDDSDPLAAKGHEVLLGDAEDTTCFGPSTFDINFTSTKAINPDICASSGQSGSLITGRVIDISMSFLLQKYDADKFKRFRKGQNIKFQSTHGLKTGGNWIPGKVCAFFSPTMTISSLTYGDLDGQVEVSITLKAYVDSNGNSEFYFGQV